MEKEFTELLFQHQGWDYKLLLYPPVFYSRPVHD